MTDHGKADLNRWIEASFREYGSDPWCFLRELAQNSRDADANRIEVTCGRLSSGEEWLTFSDNGRGMNWVAAESFLLRLYASSKNEAHNYAGTFGVGFWTVLLFRPGRIDISSRTDDESWGLSIDDHLSITPMPCSIANRGTSVTLVRPAQFEEPATFRNTLTERMSHYCRFMIRRQNDLPLDILCEGHSINTALTMGLAEEFQFRSNRLRGVLALSTTPRVDLLVKGIPVWSGCSLAELKQLYQPATAEMPSLSDFERAPAFILDAKTLKVSFTRREVIRDKDLARLVGEAQKALSVHLKNQARIAFPLGWTQKLFGWLSKNRTRIALLILFLIVTVPLLFVTLNHLTDPAMTHPAIPSQAADNPALYQGSLTAPSAQPLVHPFTLRYMPPTPLLLRWFWASGYDHERGWGQSSDEPVFLTEALPMPDGKAQYTITLRDFTATRVPFLLPALAHRYRLVSTSPSTLTPRIRSGQSQLILDVPPGLESLIYQTYPAESPPLSEAETAFWLDPLVGDEWPASWQTMILQGRRATEQDRLHLVSRLMSANFHYCRDPGQIRSPRQGDDSWLRRVLNLGMGDCDVINGFAVLLLRGLDIPARLVIGWQGRDGHIDTVLHAWCEAYVNQRWTVLDYSSVVPVWIANTPAAQAGFIWPPILLPLSFILAGSALLAFIIFLLRNRTFFTPRIKTSTPEGTRDPDQVRHSLIQTARSAILRPRLWGSDNAVWDMRLLPSIRDRISLREAVSAFNKGRLIAIGSEDTPPAPMTRPLTKNRFIRLDGSETDEICRLLPRNLDLSDIPWHSINMPQQDVLETLNEYLRREWKIVEISNQDSTAPLRWHDLRPFDGAGKAYGTRQLITLAPGMHPPFLTPLTAWEWICEHHSGLSTSTIRRVTGRILRNQA
jgi:hypothetical protein